MDTKTLQKFKNKLQELILSDTQLSKLIDSANQTIELDQARMGRLSRMDALQSQQIAQETARRQQQYNILIKKALLRIKTGDYGYCQKCDEEINLKRLEADPVHFLCINCAD